MCGDNEEKKAKFHPLYLGIIAYQVSESLRLQVLEAQMGVWLKSLPLTGGTRF